MNDKYFDSKNQMACLRRSTTTHSNNSSTLQECPISERHSNVLRVTLTQLLHATRH